MLDCPHSQRISGSEECNNDIHGDASVNGTWLSYLPLVLIACIAYLFSRFVATAGAISLDQPEYWLLALVPLITFTLVARILNRSNIDQKRFAESNFYTLCWIASLSWFLILRTTLLSESFEFPVYRYFEYKMVAPYLLLSCAYTLLGYATILTLLRGRKSRNVLRVFLGVLLNFAFFYFLVLRHPI
jgi:hypothetical protein